MKRVNQVIIYLFSIVGLMLLSANAIHADENPFSQKDATASSEKNISLTQGMCGMGRCGRCGGGMMWGGKGKPKIGDVTELPEPGSKGSKLVNRFCTQCHALPNPKLHSKEGWLVTIDRMNTRMQWMSRNSSTMNIQAPTDDELRTLIAYLETHALDPQAKTTQDGQQEQQSITKEKTAIQVLRESYARGEIERKEFLQRLEDLKRL